MVPCICFSSRSQSVTRNKPLWTAEKMEPFMGTRTTLKNTVDNTEGMRD